MYMKEIKSILLREGKHPKARTAFGVHRPLRRMSALPSAQSPRRVNRCAVRGSCVAPHVAAFFCWCLQRCAGHMLLVRYLITAIKENKRLR